MWRKSLLIAAAILVPAAALVGATPGIAGAVHPPARGSVSCSAIVDGMGAVSPGISSGGSVGGVAIKFGGKLTGCTSSVTSPIGVTVTGGSFMGSGSFNAPSSSSNGSSCANFDGPDSLAIMKVKIKWTTVGPAIAPTIVTYRAEPAPVTGPTNRTDTITLDSPYGTSPGISSFLPPPPDTLVLGTTLPAPGTGCVGTSFAFTIPTGGATFG